MAPTPSLRLIRGILDRGDGKRDKRKMEGEEIFSSQNFAGAPLFPLKQGLICNVSSTRFTIWSTDLSYRLMGKESA